MPFQLKHAIAILHVLTLCHAFQSPKIIRSIFQSGHSKLYQTNSNSNSLVDELPTIKNDSPVSRRKMFQLVFSIAGAIPTTSLIISMPPSSVAATMPSLEELRKLQVGHSRIQYLLANWDTLTQTCNNRAMSTTEMKQVVRTEGGGGGFCEKTPLIVQEYLGYKSIEDPLFRADKLMLKAVPRLDESVMETGDYVDLVERFREKSDQTSLMAYTSSWGEANPNGGKEVVDEYLDRTRDEVEETERLLRKILGALHLEVLGPSNGKL